MVNSMAPSEREGNIEGEALPAESRAVRRSGRASPVRESLKWAGREARNARKGTHACERLQNQYGGVVLRVSRGSDIEADVQDVAILDPVILAFEAEEPLIPNAFL
jgi:hypothetical protein